MPTIRSLSITVLILSVITILTFAYVHHQDFLASELAAQPEHSAAEIAALRKSYTAQMENLKITEVAIQNLTDDALAILPEWLGALEGRDRGVPVTINDIKEFCAGLREKLKTPARCQEFLSRSMGQEREDISRLWQSRKSELLLQQARYKELRREFELTVENLKKLGAVTSAKN